VQDARLQESGLGAEISIHPRSDLQQLQRPAPSLGEADAQSPPVCRDGHMARRNRRRLILRIIQTSCASIRQRVKAAVMTAVAAIDADIRPMTRASAACRRLMTIPGVGQLTALAFVAAIDDPSRIRRSRDVGAYLGLVPRRYQSGEVDYVGGISKCGDRRVRTLLYEAANVMLTRYKGRLKLKDWAFAIAKRSTMRKARVALARRLGIIMHAMLRDGTEFIVD
jgi:transposase